jgi:hypothetical protein
MHLVSTFAGVAFLSLAMSHGAAAQDVQISPWAPHVRNEHARLHDGFYLRFATGFGAYDERLRSATSSVYAGHVVGRNRGLMSLGELAFGGTIASGWVVGGGIYSSDLLASTFRSGNGSAGVPPTELDPGLRNMSLIAPFVDYYADPRSGFHLQAALGLATLTPRVLGDSATEQSTYLALGGGLMLGAGYEWWVDDEWSLGVLSRTTLAVLTGKDDADVRWMHVAVTSPGLLVTLTYH